MLVPRWLTLAVYLVLFNAVMVATSVLYRHLPAADSPAAENVEPLKQTPPPKDSIARQEGKLLIDQLNPQGPVSEKLSRLEPSDLQGNPQSIADDDPLMAEIRKQAAVQFPELNLLGGDSAGSNLVADAAAATASAVSAQPPPANPLSSDQIQSKLAAVEQLSQAAQSLLSLTSELRLTGNHTQADKTAAQAAQLQASIRDLLQ